MSVRTPQNTPAGTARQAALEAERKLGFVERQAWIDGVQCRRDLSPAARLIGGRLGWHKNLNTGQCKPGYGKLADESGYPDKLPNSAHVPTASLRLSIMFANER